MVAAAGAGHDPPQKRGLLSRYFNAYRLSSYVLALYALGHTFGAVIFVPQLGPQSDRVVALMTNVAFDAQGARDTWLGFYQGLGYLVSVFLVFSVVVTWFLGGLSARARRALSPITWSLFASYLASLVITVVYLFPTPIAFTAASAGLLGIGCIRDQLAPRR